MNHIGEISIIFAALLLAFANLPVSGESSSQARQQSRRFETKITRTAVYQYLLYIPADYDKKPDAKWPLVIFLHGMGECGDDLNKVKAHGLPKVIESGKDFPFICISPQCPQPGWDVEALDRLLDDAIKNLRVDEERIYLTGLSMGGFGTWEWAGRSPNRFAAIAPICGAANPIVGRFVKDVPVWAFHGDKDDVVPLKWQEPVIESLKESGGNVKWTVYPGVGHDSWTVTYDNPELYAWLLSHKRKAR